MVGYEPKLSRSGNGFITGLIVPRGNASDSCQLLPMFEQVVKRTGVIPGVVSVDDGYSSAPQIQAGEDRLRPDDTNRGPLMAAQRPGVLKKPQFGRSNGRMEKTRALVKPKTLSPDLFGEGHASTCYGKNKGQVDQPRHKIRTNFW